MIDITRPLPPAQRLQGRVLGSVQGPNKEITPKSMPTLHCPDVPHKSEESGLVIF